MTNRWGNNGKSDRLFLWDPKSLQMVTSAMILKDAPWKKSYDQPGQHIKKQRHYFTNNVHLVKAMVFPVVRYGYESWTIKQAEHLRINALNCGVGEDSWESLGLQGDPTRPSWRKLVLNIHWKDWCWSWNSNTLATWYEELTHWERPWCWERLKAGGEGDNRRWGDWMASSTWWTWVWENSRSWWWTGKPGVLQSMGSQRVGHDWATELKWMFPNLGVREPGSREVTCSKKSETKPGI